MAVWENNRIFDNSTRRRSRDAMKFYGGPENQLRSSEILGRSIKATQRRFSKRGLNHFDRLHNANILSSWSI